MQDVLALATNYREWTAGMRYAAQFATLRSGTLTGLFVCEPILPPPAMSTPLAFPQMLAFSTEVQREARAAEPEFVRWAESCGAIHPHWLVAEGYLAHALAQAANWHDVLVLEAGGESALGNVGALGQILLTCGSPCIVVPQAFGGKAKLDTIAVGWKGTAESVRALHAAMPLLRQARRVVLIEGSRDEPFSSVAWQPPFSIDTFLARHRLTAEKVQLRTDDEGSGAELLRIAGEEGADLLVLGAYGRTRLSEWILGGATRHVLAHSAIPLLMRH